jgi:dTDP-4-amino-4,6-dideoxygalactose transaminase
MSDVSKTTSKTSAPYSIPWWQVDFGPEAATAAANAVAKRCLSQGPVSMEVERQVARLVDSSYAIATSSGSTALTLALMAAGAQPGDIVICPAYTWIATAHAAHLLGCTVEIVDILPDRPVMDVSQVPDPTDRRRFAIPVHMNGHAADVHCLKEKGYIVIEDAAQALGSKSSNLNLGSIGDLGCFSFSVAKIIGSGQGGVIVTNSELYAERARAMRTHGVLDVFAPESWLTPGHNFRYNDVLAAVLLTQIPFLEQRIAHARSTLREYRAGLDGLNGIIIVEHESPEQIGPYVEARVSALVRNQLVNFLSKHGVGARRAFPPLHSALYLMHFESRSFTNAAAWSDEVLYLPSGPALGAEEVSKVCALVKQWYKL